jgi:putative hydrolase of the HAD superfamily
LLEPYPDVPPTFDRLRRAGFLLGLVSDGLASVQRAKLRALATLVGRLDVVVLTGELGPGHAKPSPVPFRVASTLLDVPPGDCTYVGNDPRKDFEGARRCGLRTIRVRDLPDEGGAEIGSTHFPHDADDTLASFSHLVEVLGTR